VAPERGDEWRKPLAWEASKGLFELLFPNRPAEGFPIGYVTDGVHMPSWDSAAADD
jgi:glycogen phosphorylase